MMGEEAASLTDDVMMGGDVDVYDVTMGGEGASLKGRDHLINIIISSSS
jgi:hypothetical protein